jgi:dihydropteroate synthase
MRLMGILNVTPDSFSDGGEHLADPVAAGVRLWDDGADIVDVGGESTRPGADEVSTEEELGRVIPVIAGLRERRRAGLISVDTRRAAVAEAALAAGADLVNDVSGGGDPGMLPAVGRAGRGMVLGHMRGSPRTMASLTRYGDVRAEVWSSLDAAERRAREAGVTDVWLDPGIGFAKDLAGNLALLRALPRDRRVCLGASRKRFIGELSGEADARRRLPGSLAVALHARRVGVDLLRVHDVAATRQALAVWDALAVPS